MARFSPCRGRSAMSRDRSGPTPAPNPQSVGSGERSRPLAPSSGAEIDAFLSHVNTLGPAATADGRGRLIFALDATMSRQPTWDQACVLQADMFREAASGGGLDIQLVYYRGLAECRASSWIAQPDRFGELMSRIDCRGGQTQIGKVLAHARRESDKGKIGALVFVGDAMEEKLDVLASIAGKLGLKGVPVFLFHEGSDATAARAFQEIARLTRGAYCRFDANSAEQLRALLGAVAAYAAGGAKALAHYGKATGGAALLLAHQLGAGK